MSENTDAKKVPAVVAGVDGYAGAGHALRWVRRFLIMATAVSVVALAPAVAQAANITITKTGFTPSTLTIAPGDSVTWTNTDTADHQVVSDKAGLASPVLHSGQSYTFKFSTVGTFAIQDALDKKSKGARVVVQAAPAPKPAPASQASVSLTASSLQVVYNGRVTLAGKVSSQKAGEIVTLEAQSYGQNGFAKLADLTTTTGGAWSYSAKPTIRTVYESKWGNKTSPQATVGVHPLVAFHVLTGSRFSTKVAAGRSFAGKVVRVQRRSSLGQWVTLKQPRLNTSSAAIFRLTLPHGTSSLRVAFSINQAGAGYLGGMSRTIVYHRA